MSGRPIQKGDTNVSSVVRIIDSTAGTPETGVTSATGGLAFNYRREAEIANAITAINDLAALTTAHTDGGILHIGDGYYRVDFQDAAFAAGAGEDGVLLTGTATGMIVIGTYHPLVDHDPVAALTSLSTKQDSDMVVVATSTSDIKSALVVVDTEVSDLDSALVLLSTKQDSDMVVVATATSDIKSALVVVDTEVSDLDSALVLLSTKQDSDMVVVATATSDIKSALVVVDTEVSDLDSALVLLSTKQDSDMVVVATATSDIKSALVIVDTEISDLDSALVLAQADLDQITLGADTIVSGAAEAGTLSVTQMTSNLTEATDDHYIGRVVIWTSGVLANQASDITDYTGATGMLTYTAVTEAPSATDTFVIV